MSKLKWGILSTSFHGLTRILPAMRKSEHGEVVAIASRTLDKAQAAATEHGIPKAYGSYDELFADPNIDVIFNTTPNNLHVDLTLQAVAAGKHVLIEKPIAMNAAETEKLLATKGKALVMEAFMVRFHPQWMLAKQWIDEGRIGELRMVQSFQAFNNMDPANVRNIVETGGGAGYDLCCYGILSARNFFGCEPEKVIGLFDRDPHFGTDRMVSGILDFGKMRQHTMMTSTQCGRRQRLVLAGAEGFIELQVPYNPAAEDTPTVFIGDGQAFDGQPSAMETMPAGDQYLLQCDAFSQAVKGEIDLPFGIEESVRNMRVLDALFRSETSGHWESV